MFWASKSEYWRWALVIATTALLIASLDGARMPIYVHDGNRNLLNHGFESGDGILKIIEDGKMQDPWMSWSWGWRIPQSADGTPPQGTMCMEIDPFGALSLKGAKGVKVEEYDIQIRVTSKRGWDDLKKLDVQLEYGGDNQGQGYFVSWTRGLTDLDHTTTSQNVTTFTTSAKTFVEEGKSSLFDRVSIGRCLGQQQGRSTPSSGNCERDDGKEKVQMCVEEVKLVRK